MIRREIRGLVFDSNTGELVSRTLHKFFNIGERPETDIKKISINDSNFWILEKLDGSMVTPLLENGVIRFRTKLGYNGPFTDPIEKFVYGHNQVEKFGDVKSNFLDFCSLWLKQGFTPIFEWTSPYAKIIIDYKEKGLTLIAMRNIISGAYLTYPDQINAAKEFKIPCVNAEEFKVKNTTDLVSLIKDKKGLEGYVLRFEDGRMYKIKCKWYSDLHRCKSHLKWNSLSEMHVWDLVLGNKVDDTIATLDTEEEKKKLQEFNDLIYNSIDKKVEELKNFVMKAKEVCQSKKDFVSYCKDVDPIEQKLIYLMYDKGLENVEEYLISHLKTLITKNSTLLIAKKLLGGNIVWVPFVDKGQNKLEMEFD